MPPDHKALVTLGLTEYGARAYRALVALGPSPAAEVAAAAPVPRTKVYTVLTDLVERGWVEEEAGRPKLYRARHPRECFERERARIDGLLDDSLPGLEEHYNDRATRFMGPLWLLAGGEALAERTLRMIRRAREDVLLVASFPLPGEEDALGRAVRDALKRGVRVRVGVPDVNAPHARTLAATGAELREVPVPPRILTVDGKQALLTFPLPRPGGGIDLKGIWHASPELLEIIGAVALFLWDQGRTVAQPDP